MKRKAWVIILAVILCLAIVIFYLNNVFLPTKIKSLIINALKEATHKKISLEALQFNVFKGLVLKNLTIYEGQEVIISVKEASCSFLIWPIFRKTIIIPVLRIKSCELFIQRNKDKTFNLEELFSVRGGEPRKERFNIGVQRVSITDARINFKDETLTPAFSMGIENLDLNLYLSLPASAKFNLKFKIKSNVPTHIEAHGEYKILSRQLQARAVISGLSAGDFFAYYRGLGILIPEGTLDADVDVELKEDTLYLDTRLQSKFLAIAKDKISVRLNLDTKASLEYSLKNNLFKFSGKAKFNDSLVAGLEFVDRIDNINAEFVFNNSGVLSDKISARIFENPFEAAIKLEDFLHPKISFNASSGVNLDRFRNILIDKFKLSIPIDLSGEGKLFLAVETEIPQKEPARISGYLDLMNATVKTNKSNLFCNQINGRLEFNNNQLKWSDLNFKYLDSPYKTSGVLTNFQAPGVQLRLSSQDLLLETGFAINNKLINIAQCAGSYFNSEFEVSGIIDTSLSPDLETAISGKLKIDLRDARKFRNKFQKQLEEARLEGEINGKFKFSGNLNNLKTCALKADFAGDAISCYGLRAEDFVLNYIQENGVMEVPLLHFLFYDGVIEAKAGANLNSANIPYRAQVDIQGVKIEKLKLDTPGKKQDISGVIQSEIRVSGFSDNLSKLSGAGNIFITEGKLWQLNLFKGLGSLLFEKDFSNIVFNEGSCGFTIQDKFIFTDNLMLKSNITDITGSLKLGFDSSIDALLNIHVLDEMVPLSGTLKDLTTAIIGQAGRFGVIKVSGTLREPKYKFQPAVANIMKGLKDVIFGR